MDLHRRPSRHIYLRRVRLLDTRLAVICHRCNRYNGPALLGVAVEAQEAAAMAAVVAPTAAAACQYHHC